MEERKNAEKTVSRADGNELSDTLQFGGEIAVGQHHPFRVAGGSRGVNNCRNVVRLQRNRNKAGLRRQHHLRHAGQSLMRRVQHRQLNRTACNRFPGHGEAAFVHEEQCCATVVEQFSDLERGERRVKRNGGIAAGDDAKVGRNPTRTVEGEYSTTCASNGTSADAGLNQPLPHPVGNTAKLLVGKTFNCVTIGGRNDAGEGRWRQTGSGLPLNRHCGRRRPALHGFQETAVKHRISPLQHTGSGAPMTG